MKRRITHYILIGLIACGLFGVPPTSFAGKWEEKAPLLRKRWGLGTETVSGKIYAIGGQDDLPVAGKKVAEYDPERDQWTEKKSMPTGRFRLATSVVRGRIYVFGGTTNNFEAVPTVEEYDPKTDTWTKKADMPTARLGLAAAVVGGKIYTIGGAESFFFPSGAVEVYDPLTDTWEKRADMPNPRWGISAVAVASKIYVSGGAVDNSHQKCTDTMEMYTPKTDTWTKKSDMPIDYFNVGFSFVNSGRIYAIGGQKWEGRNNDGRLNDGWTLHWTVFEYDVEKDKWTRLNDDLPTERSILSTSVVNGIIYAIGGWEGGCCGPTAIVEAYTPNGWPFPKAFSVSPQSKLATKWGAIKQRQ